MGAGVCPGEKKTNKKKTIKKRVAFIFYHFFSEFIDSVSTLIVLDTQVGKHSLQLKQRCDVYGIQHLHNWP